MNTVQSRQRSPALPAFLTRPGGASRHFALVGKTQRPYGKGLKSKVARPASSGLCAERRCAVPGAGLPPPRRTTNPETPESDRYMLSESCSYLCQTVTWYRIPVRARPIVYRTPRDAPVRSARTTAPFRHKNTQASHTMCWCGVTAVLRGRGAVGPGSDESQRTNLSEPPPLTFRSIG